MTYTYTIDTQAPPVGPLFEVVDKEKGTMLSIALMNGQAQYALGNRHIKAHYTKPDGTEALQESGITMGAGNAFTMDVPPAYFSPGIMHCELQVWYTPEPEPEVPEEEEEGTGGAGEEPEGATTEEPPAPEPELEATVAFQFLCYKAKVRKRFHISLDTKRATGNREFEVVDGDNGNVLAVTLTDDGVPVDLAHCFVTAVFSKPNGRTAEQDSNGNGVLLFGEQGNELEIELYVSSVSPGLVECEVLVFSGEEQDTLITSARFNFACRRGIANKTTMAETDEWPLLVGMIGAEKQRQANELARIGRDEAGALWEEYDPETPYEPLNKVAYNGSSYLCLEHTTGHAPGDPAYWLMIARQGKDGGGAATQAEKMLHAEDWQDGAQRLFDDNIRADSPGDICIAQNAEEDAFRAWGELQPHVTGQEDGSITITARGAVPRIAIPVVLEVRT